MRALAFLLALPLVACSVDDPTRASTAPLSAPAPDARAILATVSAAGFALADDPAVTLRAEAEAIVPIGLQRIYGFHPAAAERLAARLPLRARNALRIAHDGAPGFFVDVRGVDTTDAAFELVADSVVYRDAAPSTDVLLHARRGAIEELRVVHDRGGISALSWTLSLGPAVARAELREGAIELLDARGSARLVVTAPRAVDAKGQSHALTLRLDGLRMSIAVEGTPAFPLVVDPLFTAAAKLGTARDFHTATALGDGTVLTVGGTSNESNTLATTELFDVASSTWSAGATLNVARRKHGAVLTSGKLLVVGGEDAGALASAETYDIATKSWSLAGTMATARIRPAVAKLPDGSVLVAGGEGASGAIATAEIWDPSTSTFSATASMSVARAEPMIVALGDGRVLVAGGWHGSVIESSAEIFDPSTKTWSPAPAMKTARYAGVAYPLSDGGALVAGGRINLPNADPFGFGGTLGTDASERFVPTLLGWISTQSMNRSRARFGAVALGNDRLVAAGGEGNNASPGKIFAACDLYGAAPAQWFGTDSGLDTYTERVAMAALNDNTALAVGGLTADGSPTRNVDSFRLKADGEACDPLVGGPYQCLHACIDLVCCNTTCEEPCMACNLSGKEGTCSPKTGKPAPPRTCGTRFESCVAGACATSCAKDDDCAPGYFCSDGDCKFTKSQGDTCTDGHECASSTCADGYCCEAACANPCQACNVPGSYGQCAPVLPGTPPRDLAACAGYVCAGDGTCRSKCSDDAGCARTHRCTGGVCTPRAAHECTTDQLSSVDTASGVAESCSPYRCDPNGTCRTSCVGTGECAPDHACDLDTRTCVPSDERRTGGACAYGSGQNLGAFAIGMVSLCLFAARRRRAR